MFLKVSIFFLMREDFIFCSVLVVGFNTGLLVNLVFAILILLSSPPLPNPLTYTHINLGTLTYLFS